MVRIQIELPSADGPSIWLEGSLGRIHRQEEALLAILHDATGRVESETRRERELQQENYLARYNAMGDMAMVIAHELSQPLAAARNYLVGLNPHAATAEPATTVEGNTPARRAQLALGIRSAQEQIERASAIVSAARLFVGHLEHVEQVIDLNAIVEECLHLVRLRARPGWVELDIQLDEEPVLVRCVRVLTGQVFL
jgi:two-component system, LuxR family, sensor kinase FixL